MKKLNLAFLLLFLCTGITQAQKSKTSKPAAAAGLTLKNGDVLVYEVTSDNQTWHFEVTVKEIREAIVFDWVMPEKDISGEVTLEKEARASATAYINRFADSTEKDLTDSITVWMSKKNYSELKKGNTILSLDDMGAERFDRKESSTLGIVLKGRGTNLRMFRASNGKAGSELHEMWILDQAAQPLILKMNLGWTIVLKEIKTL